jgi:hypothetical protein
MRARAASARATNSPAFTTIIRGVLLRFCVIIIYCALKNSNSAQLIN